MINVALAVFIRLVARAFENPFGYSLFGNLSNESQDYASRK